MDEEELGEVGQGWERGTSGGDTVKPRGLAGGTTQSILGTLNINTET